MKNLLILILLFSSLIGCAQNKLLTYENIISSTYDIPKLATLPPKGEKGALASSYDRRSKYDEKNDTYLEWRANGDYKGVVKYEGEYAVLADIKGPGVIWRTWSASVADGKVQVYLDGKLVIDLPWEDYFSGKIAPFNRKGLVYTAARGKNNYTPITFQKSCKIVTKITKENTEKFTFDKGIGVWGKFFHFNYTLFPEGTKIQTFKMQLSQAENKALDKASKILSTDLGKNPVKYENIKTENVTWAIPAGKSKTLTISGKEAITALRVRIPKRKNYKNLLRQMTLSINWDNEKSPSVWAPLGDFFGTGWGVNEYKSLLMGMRKLGCQVSGVRCQKTEDGCQVSGVRGQSKEHRTSNIEHRTSNKGQGTEESTNPDEISNIQHGISNDQVKSTNPLIQQSNNPSLFEFYSYWYMPFEKNAEITIRNDSDKEETITLIVDHSPLRTSFDNLGYFHVKWHKRIESEKSRGDWLILETSGRGRFVGTVLNVWNPGGRWWGEGDEKFYVDGEKFPSTIGTGSEDYFGFAWCFAKHYSRAYHSQTLNHNNTGHISNNRWHFNDNIPFQKSFVAAIEKFFSDERPTLYDGVAYWYLSKNGADNFKPLPLKDRMGEYPPFKLFRVPNVIEVEKLPVTTTKGILTTLYLPDVGWSADEQFWQLDGAIGESIEFKVKHDKAEEKDLIVRVTKDKDYANIQFYFNGKKVGDVIDCYHIKVIVSGEINLGKVKIKKGENLLKVKIVSATPKNIKRYMVGLDYIKFE